MKKHFIAGIIIGVVSFILVLIVSHFNIFQVFELKAYDYKFQLRTVHKVDPNIIVAAIDDNSIVDIGRWPWPRKIHAAFLQGLGQFPPKAVGFDILFTEPDELSKDGDAALSYYSRLLGNVVFAGYVDDKDERKVLPIDDLVRVSAVGFINAPPDIDGIIRKIPLVIKNGEKYLPSFTLQILCEYLDIKFSELNIESGVKISLPKIGDIPIDRNGCMWINYVGGQHVFTERAYQQILSWTGDETKMADFGNTIVLAGITATGLGDKGNIPVATNVPLVAVHANGINTILSKDFLRVPPGWMNILLVLFLVLASTAVNIVFKTLKAGLSSVMLVSVYLASNLFLFRQNIVLNVIAPVMGVILPFVFITFYRYRFEEGQKRWIKKVFGQYLSKDVVESVIKDPSKLKLGGELKTATVMYLDLRNFSTYCEGKCPSEVVGFLNNCFDWMTDIIVKNKGMLDKYIGDAIMAIFGAPLEASPSEQVESAVRAAIEIEEKWREMPDEIRRCLGIGIGINTGPMLIGNMGSKQIFNYTAIGDEVNIASRVEGLTRQYKTNIIITDSVYELIKNSFKTELLGEVQVKGRTSAVRIYSVISKLE